jgi:TonB family protein
MASTLLAYDLTPCYILTPMRRHFVFLAVLVSFVTPNASAHDDDFGEWIAKASHKSSLTEPGSRPFHLKLEASETRHNDPQYKAEIEVWWAAPDKWRREVKSPVFSQTAVQEGKRYYESNSSDYLPWWLHELIQESVDPIPVAELKDEDVELTRQGCAKWETEYSKEKEKITVYNNVCFNADGTAKYIFTRTLGTQFGDYQKFGDKHVARAITVSAYGPGEVKGKVTLLERLGPNDSHFAMPSDTSINSRVRFLSVPESALEPDMPSTPPVNWPVVHNFPGTGAITINVKLDRSGSVREVGGIVSSNVVLNDAALEQVKTLKFKPYLSDGSPVQVNTNITLRYETKVELLGANGKSYVAERFLSRIKKARELSDPRMEESKPFHLHASFQAGENAPGTYEETWLAPTKWRRQAQLGSVTVVESRSDNKFYRKFTGSDFSPRQIDSFLDGMDGPLPRTDGSFQEPDWGQSAVQLDGIDMVRVARGQVDSKNQPISGQAYWFDSAGLLRAAYVQPRTTTYNNFEAWNGKQIPRHAELAENGVRLMVTSIDQIELPAETTDSLFILDGVKPEIIGDSGNSDGPDLVQPQPIYRVKPENPPSGHGTVLVDVQMDTHGHVLTAKVRQSVSQALDDAAVRAAMQWEFTPMLIKGKRVPGFATLRFNF